MNQSLIHTSFCALLFIAYCCNYVTPSILISGGTGFVGTALKYYLKKNGYTVKIVSRKAGSDLITWEDLKRSGIPADTDAVVNLVGANILKPGSLWSDAYKKEVYESRVNRTQDLVHAIQTSNRKLNAFVSFSGVGIYDPAKDTPYTEHSDLGPNATDFFQSLTRDWEAAAQTASKDVRTTIIRSGVVLGNGGGLVKSSFWPYFFFLGGPMGSGKQPMPWIHIHDLVRIILLAIQNKTVNGVINGVAPQIITNKEFSTAFGSAMNRPAAVQYPEWALNTLFGAERAKIMLQGQKVHPKRLLEEYKFDYKYPNIDSACKEVVFKFFPKTPFTDSSEIK